MTYQRSGGNGVTWMQCLSVRCSMAALSAAPVSLPVACLHAQQHGSRQSAAEASMITQVHFAWRMMERSAKHGHVSNHRLTLYIAVHGA